MASEFIADDFNRAAGSLASGVSTGIDGVGGGWPWFKTVGGGLTNSLLIGDIDTSDAIGVRNGAGVGDRVYRANELIAGEAMGASIDTALPGSGNRGAALALRVENNANYLFATISHDTGLVLIRQVGGGVVGFAEVASTTMGTPPTPPYQFAFYMIGGSLHVLVDGVEVLSGGVADPEILLLDNYVGIGHFSNLNGPNVRYDNFRGGLPWLLGIGVSAPSQQNESDPNVQRRLLDEQRRASLLGGRQNTVLTSPLGLDDDVPIAKIHPIGRCGPPQS